MLTKPERGMPVKVLLSDGQEHELRFPLGILKELKAAHGLDMLRNGSDITACMNDPEKLALILSYGLRTASPEATIEWVEQHVDAAMLLDIGPYLLYAATGQWVGDLREKAEELAAQIAAGAVRPNGKAPEDPTGSTFGPSGASTSDSQKTSSGG